MPPALKRARTSSTSSPTTASRAVALAIETLASSSSTLEPALFSQLLGSLHDAHAMAIEQEGVVMKQEDTAEEEGQQVIATPRVSPQPQVEQVRNLGRSWTRLIQMDDKTDDVVKRVLEDVEAALPKLDELGILLRPLCVEGKIDLMIWEFAIPGKAEWSGSLFKGIFKFPPEYPKHCPNVKTVPPLFHPNVYPSGTIDHRYFQLAETLTWPIPDSDVVKEHYGRGYRNKDEWYRTLPAILRIPIVLQSCHLALQFPNLDDPTQLDAYQMAKKTPELYVVKQKEVAASLMPTMADALDLEDARKRVLARQGK